MSVIDVDALLKAISPDAPAGADVEFDPAYFALEKLARGTPESVMGDEVKPAEEPDFAEVKKAALDLFSKTRDLRVAMILASALLKQDGLAGFRDGVALLKGFIDQLWDHFYPKLDPSDNNDPTIRLNILKGLEGDLRGGDNSPDDLFKFKLRVREAILTNSKQKIGRFSYRDVQIARGELPPPPVKEGTQAPPPPDTALVNAAFKDTASEDLQATQATIREIVELLDGLDAALTAKIGAGQGPDLTPLQSTLNLVQGVVQEQLALRGIGEAPAPGQPAAGPAAARSPAGGGGVAGVALTGEIASRDDVVRVLDKICEYYQRFEPASPVPIFMQRAKRLVTMNFVDLIKDLAPEAMAKIDIFTGAPGENPS
jgi:type VI secretion system protein ImpA